MTGRSLGACRRIVPIAVAILAAGATLVSACASDGTHAATTASGPVATSAPTSVPTSSSASPTAAPNASNTNESNPSSSNTDATAAGLIVSGGGLADTAFGASPDAVISVVAASLGQPESDLSAILPNPIDGVFVDEAGGLAFPSPFARQVCWPAFCVYLGGTTEDDLAFAGWSLSGVSTAAVTNLDGVTVGTRWSEATGSITVQPGGCPQSGFGSTSDGIDIDVAGGAFATVTSDGEYVEMLPDPADVTVVAMAAGSRLVPVETGC